MDLRSFHELGGVGQGRGLTRGTWRRIIDLCKASSKFVRARSLQLNDILILAAMVVAVGESVAVSQQVAAGLGRHEQDRTKDQVNQFEKAGYSSQFLYLLAVCLGKCAHASFIASLSKIRWCQRSALGILGLSVLWTVAGVLTVAFQCRVPNTWQIVTGQCVNMTAFWGVIGALDIVLDVALIVLPGYIIWCLQMPQGSKSMIIGAFSTRVLVIPLIILRVVYIGQAQSATDPIYAAYKPSLVTQLAMNVGIISTCAPFLKAVIDRAEHGIFTNDLTIQPGVHGSQPRSYVLGSLRGQQKEERAERDRKSLPRLGAPINWLASPIANTSGSSRTTNDEERVTMKGDKGVIRKDTKLWVEAETKAPTTGR
ncbi:MAG: hypothetical protein M1828_003510 [Chrysothrix sp. TS-e1954]|nr:MAG: hypothetical protein M1828_003510 [Chrysothrix sp. TS-e1954]